MEATNPVLYDAATAADDLLAYSQTLSEFAWRNRLVGVCRSGFLYVDEKIARKGFYEFPAKRLAWNEVMEVQIKRGVSIRGFLGGVVLLFLAFCALAALVRGQGHTAMPFKLFVGCGIVGGTLVFGAVRNRIVVVTTERSYSWQSGPLAYAKTLPLCQQTAERCRPRDFFLTSHV